MKLGVKAVKIYKGLSEETTAFSCNIYFNDVKCGYAQNNGHGADSEVRLNLFHKEIAEHSLTWLNQLEPNPLDYSKPATLIDGYPHFERIPASLREEQDPHVYLVNLIDIFITNFQIIRDMKKIKRVSSFLTESCGEGEYVKFGIKPKDINDTNRAKLEGTDGFKEWLYTLPEDEIAMKLGVRKEHHGPLVLFATTF